MGLEATVPCDATKEDASVVAVLFHEGPGVVVEVDAAHEVEWVAAVERIGDIVPILRLGITTATGRCVLGVASTPSTPCTINI